MSRRHERGQTTVEFALVIPVMLLFLLGIFQVGETFFNNEAIATSARDGARAAAIHTGSTPAQIVSYATAAVKSGATGLNSSNLSISVTDLTQPGVWAQGDTIDVKVTYPWKIGVLAFSQSGTLSTETKLLME